MRPTSQHTRRNVLRLLATTGVASSIPFMVEPAFAWRGEDERLQGVCGSVTEAGGRSLRLTDTTVKRSSSVLAKGLAYARS